MLTLLGKEAWTCHENGQIENHTFFCTRFRCVFCCIFLLLFHIGCQMIRSSFNVAQNTFVFMLKESDHIRPRLENVVWMIWTAHSSLSCVHSHLCLEQSTCEWLTQGACWSLISHVFVCWPFFVLFVYLQLYLLLFSAVLSTCFLLFYLSVFLLAC